MRVAALFAGIGGLEHGFHKAGLSTVMTCEVWEPARLVLAKRFPQAADHTDVTTLKSLPSGVDVLTAGFPCQDLSQAGMTAGIGGRKSGLVEHVFRLIDRRGRKVPTVVLENVSFMLQLDRGAAMDRLAAAFEERGYRWAYRIVNSLAFLPQRRERVYFVASRGAVDPASVLFRDQVAAVPPQTRLDTHAHGFYWTEGTRGLGWAPDAVPTLKNGSTVGIPSPPAILMPNGDLIKPDIRDAERLQGFPSDWTAGAPERFRWSLVGNAVTVPVAAWLGKRLVAGEDAVDVRSVPWPSSGRWPRAAMFDGVQRVAVEISDLPRWAKRRSLHLFLAHTGTPLSVRATAGFLSRAEASSLRFVPGFLDRVRAHLRRMEPAHPLALGPIRERRQPTLFAAE